MTQATSSDLKKIELKVVDVREYHMNVGFDNSLLEELDQVQTTSNAEFAHSLESNMARIRYRINLVGTKEGMATDVTCRSTIDFHFFYPNLEEKTSKDDDNAFDKDFVVALMMIAYGTCRGILSSKLQQSVFSNFLLPVLTPQDYLEHLSS